MREELAADVIFRGRVRVESLAGMKSHTHTTLRQPDRHTSKKIQYSLHSLFLHLGSVRERATDSSYDYAHPVEQRCCITRLHNAMSN